MVKVKVEPSPSSLSTCISPPCSPTILAARKSPTPIPGYIFCYRDICRDICPHEPGDTLKMDAMRLKISWHENVSKEVKHRGPMRTYSIRRLRPPKLS